MQACVVVAGVTQAFCTRCPLQVNVTRSPHEKQTDWHFNTLALRSITIFADWELIMFGVANVVAVCGPSSKGTCRSPLYHLSRSTDQPPALYSARRPNTMDYHYERIAVCTFKLHGMFPRPLEVGGA